MSRGYKMYNRKVHAVSQTSIQFDKLFHENSNRPTASKSAGTVGKWGVISCTSLRSTNLKGRRDETVANKRKLSREHGSRAAKHTTPEDPFSFDSEPAVGRRLGGNSTPVQPVIKPKKFFKSRNTDPAAPSEAITSESVYQGSNRSSGASYGSKKCGKESAIAEQSSSGSKKFFTSKKSSALAAGEQTEAMNLSSPTKSASPSKVEHKPPIVLRIFKGTSHLVNETDDKAKYSYHSNKQSSSSDTSVVTRTTRNSTRSARNNSDLGYESQLASSLESRKRHSISTSPNSNITESHKKTKTLKISITPPSSSYEDIVRLAMSNSSNCPTAETLGVGIVNDAVTEADASSGDEMLDRSNSSEDIPSAIKDEDVESSLSLVNDVNDAATQENQHLPDNTISECVEDQAQNSHVETPNDVIEGDCEDQLSTNKDDVEKLIKSDELLQNTCTDFTAAAEKLLSVPALTTSKPEKDHDWFSDSEDSSGMIEQINADAVVGEVDASKQDLDTTLESEQPTDRTNSPATKKKGSIFKSRSLVTDGSKKRLALYKHKWSDNDKLGSSGGNSSQPSASQPCSSSTTYTDLDEEFVSEKLTRVTSWPMTDKDSLDLEETEAITSVKCTKKAKGFYTVVRNVQKAHQIQESGEFQEFNDDVEYILDALQDTFPVGTRCLSAITLASKCMVPAFRMHVRAHGTVAKFFRALHDATKDQSLGLCTATVMFVLSQDRLNMDLDRHSLELMLNLLESDVSHRHALDDCGMTDTQLHKNKQKVRELCAEIQSQGHAKHLNLDNITVGHLAMETLLSLTSRRAGEWFKEELRELGGLEHIVKTICECCRQVDDYVVEWTDPLLEKLRKVDRCLRVLENVTFQNEENQLYLIKYGDGILLDTLVQLFRQCDSEIPLYPVTDPADKDSTGTVIREVLLATLKVLINLTHDYNNQSYGSLLTGERKGIVDAALHLLLQVPNYVPDEKKFDLLVLALILLINLVEHCQSNRRLLFEARAPADPESIFQSNNKSAVQALIALFYQQEEQARNEELKTDAILDGKKDTEQPEVVPEKPKSHEEFIEETVAKLLQKAGRNMEHTLISAYVGLLLGYLIMDNAEFETYVRQCFPDQNFKTMVAVLQKVYNFMNLTASAVGSSRGIAQTERVINYLTKSDSLAEAPDNKSSPTNEEDNFS